MDRYEIAVLRILVKSHHPMTVSNLVDGFPDYSENNVLQAVSKLHLLGYVSVHDSLPEYISLNKNTKKEVLRIVDPSVCNAAPSTGQVSKEIAANTNNKLEHRIKGRDESSRYKPIAITRTTASVILVASIIIMTMSSLGSSMTSSFDQSNQVSYSSSNKIQTLNPSIYGQEVNLNSFAIAKGSYPIKDASASNLIILVDGANSFHRIIINIGANPPNLIYLKNAFLVLNI